MRDLLRCLAFWRKCPYHRYMQRACFCNVHKGEYP